jgi:hypothetical protein
MDYDISVYLGDSRFVHLTELADRTVEEQGLSLIENDGGLWVVFEDKQTGAFDILAAAASIEAGEQLLSLMARKGAGI